LRLIRRKETVRHCALYGVRGQYQAGIDFYAHHESGEFTVYQCKRIKTVTPATIRSAVARFRKGRWAKTAKHLIFCTTHDLSDTKLQDEIVAQEELLAKDDITFGTLSGEDIVLELKELPRLVYDFFGKHIAIDFCGAEIVEALGSRIETGDLNRLRSDLRALYASVFRMDARDMLRDDSDLRVRFVDLDVIERDLDSPSDESRPADPDMAKTDPRSPIIVIDRGSLASPPAPPPQAMPAFRRQAVLRWLGSSEAPNLLLGEVGSGRREPSSPHVDARTCTGP
jgi:hypothetical protein